jgi:predicted O-methyltransferase YrrM
MTWDELVAHVTETSAHVNDATFAYMDSLYRHAQGANAIMEIGIGPESVSGATFAAAMGKGGILYSLDIDEDRPTAAQVAFVQSLGVTWIIAHGDSKTSDFAPNKMLDLLYVDGNHENDYVENDHKKWGCLVKPGGHIIFDDCRETHPPVNGNCKFFEYDPPHKNGHFIYLVP